MTKTIFSLLLTVIYIFLPFMFPFSPLQMMPVSTLTVGIPSFFLVLRASSARPANRMLENILDNALPASLVIVIGVMYSQAAGALFGLTTQETSTMCVFMIGMVGYFLLLRLSKPYSRGIWMMIILLGAGIVLTFAYLGGPFALESLLNRNALFCLPMIYGSYHLFKLLCGVNRKVRKLWDERKEEM